MNLDCTPGIVTFAQEVVTQRKPIIGSSLLIDDRSLHISRGMYEETGLPTGGVVVRYKDFHLVEARDSKIRLPEHPIIISPVGDISSPHVTVYADARGIIPVGTRATGVGRASFGEDGIIVVNGDGCFCRRFSNRIT